MNATTSIRQELNRCLLNEEEIADPALGIKKFLDGESIDEVRRHFEVLREAVLTESYGELEANDKWLLLNYMYRLETLIESAYIIDKTNTESKKNVDAEKLRVEQILSRQDLSGLYKVVEIIKDVSKPEKIYSINHFTDPNNPKNSKYDFLVLLTGQNEPYVDLEKRIDLACDELGSVLVSFRRIGEVNSQLKDGHLFYSAICLRENRLFNNKDSHLIYPKKIKINKLTDLARSRFQLEFKKAQTFISGANYYIFNAGEHNASAYMLHQAVELTIRAILMGYMGYSAYGHNLFHLLRHTYRFNAQLSEILSKGDTSDNSLLHLLNRAYTQTRYTNEFTITADQVAELNARVTQFQKRAEQLFEEKMNHFNKTLK